MTVVQLALYWISQLNGYLQVASPGEREEASAGEGPLVVCEGEYVFSFGARNIWAALGFQ